MELLTKQEKFILISCNSDSRSDVVLNKLKQTIDDDTLRSVFASLKNKGFFSRVTFAENSVYEYVLSHKGKNFKEIHRQAVKSFILCNVAVPIFVAFATTVITSLILN